MKILSIETSCDETSAAVIENSTVLSNIISSQYFHKNYGGVVPELASRAHLKYIKQIVEQAINNSNVNIKEIQAIAVTSEPGLAGSLLVGANFAKGLSIKYNIPIVPVNHIEGHLYSGNLQNNNLQFPYVSLVVSGGHTLLFFVESYNKYKILGSTIDDAAGEAFDKIAKMFGLDYPGGPEIDKYAKIGNSKKYNFPRSMIHSGDFNFSFSGLKTSIRYFLKKEFPNDITEIELPDLCASAQQAIVDVLVSKTINAAKQNTVSNIVIGGGVSANSKLRIDLESEANKINISIVAPALNYCMDNAAMIGFIAEKKLSDINSNNLYHNLMFTVSANALRATR